MPSSTGKVYLIGAGPGDPGLLTRKAAQVLARCDVVFYDYLVNPHLLELVVPPDTPRIYVGKSGAHQGADTRQSHIHDLLCQHAQQGQTVARLKGGDPFVFGRGGEEAEVLRQAKIDFEIIPGISSAIAAPAYAGIPVTHRNFNTALAIVTGHQDPRLPKERTSWQALAHFTAAGGTLVILMGVKNLARNMGFLLAEGVDPATPVAMVRWGTLPHQRVLVSRVDEVAQKVREAGLGPPAVCVVGPTVALRERLDWFSPGSLEGRRVLLTRTREASQEPADLLRSMGAIPVILPTLEVVPAKDDTPLREALCDLGRYDVLALTSANAVHAVMRTLRELNLDARALAPVQLACVGKATATALEAYALRADLTPERATAADLARRILDHQSKRVWAALASDARNDLPETLQAAGVKVDVVEAYRKVLPAPDPAALEMLLSGQVDAALFASPSALRGLSTHVSPRRLEEVMQKTTVVCIGPVTAQAAQEMGLDVEVVPEDTSMTAMIHDLAAHWEVGDGVQSG